MKNDSLKLVLAYALVFGFGFFFPFLDMMSGPHWLGWDIHTFTGLVFLAMANQYRFALGQSKS